MFGAPDSVQPPLFPGLVIRQVTQGDLLGLEWEGEYSHFRNMYQEAFQIAQSGKAVLWIADLPGDGLIGQLFIHLDGQRRDLADGLTCAYLYAFRVRPQHRRKGLGGHLLRVAEADLQQRKFQKITLNVARINSLARSFYEKRGYRVVAPEAGRWSYIDLRGTRVDVVEPSWRMEKRLGN